MGFLWGCCIFDEDEYRGVYMCLDDAKGPLPVSIKLVLPGCAHMIGLLAILDCQVGVGSSHVHKESLGLEVGLSVPELELTCLGQCGDVFGQHTIT